MGDSTGKEHRKPVGENKQHNESRTGGNERTADRDTSTKQPATGGSTTGGSTTGGSTTGGSTGDEKDKEITSVVPILADEEKRKLDEKNARRRELYAKKKMENGGTYKPKKVNKGSKKSESPMNDETLKILITTVSALIASRPGCEHWLLNESEIKSISEPLSKILSNNAAFAGISEHSNEIALVMACVTIFVPRIGISLKKSEERKKENNAKRNLTVLSNGNIGNAGGNAGGKIITTDKNDKGITGGSSGEPTGHDEDNRKNEFFVGNALM